jgi:hypothetical protein
LKRPTHRTVLNQSHKHRSPHKQPNLVYQINYALLQNSNINELYPDKFYSDFKNFDFLMIMNYNLWVYSLWPILIWILSDLDSHRFGFVHLLIVPRIRENLLNTRIFSRNFRVLLVTKISREFQENIFYKILTPAALKDKFFCLVTLSSTVHSSEWI